MNREMTAVEYLKTARRICESYQCGDCPLAIRDGDNIFYCKNPMSSREAKNPEEAVAIVQKWREEHPMKTRQSEFLKMFPNAKICKESGTLIICPVHINRDFKCPVDICTECKKCRKDYWLAELPEEEIKK